MKEWILEDNIKKKIMDQRQNIKNLKDEKNTGKSKEGNYYKNYIRETANKKDWLPHLEQT